MGILRWMVLLSVVLMIGCSDESTAGEAGDCGDQCAAWEQCNSSNQCELKDGKCNSNTDCTGDTNTECKGDDEHTCVAPVACTPDEKRCSGTDLEICGADKTWSVSEKCADSGNICSETTLSCVADGGCTSGDKKCSDNTIYSCSENRWDVVASCGSKICQESGNNAICVEDTGCTDGDKKCDGNTIMVCQGNNWRSEQDCGDSAACTEGENGVTCENPSQCVNDGQCKESEYCNENQLCIPHGCEPSGEALCDSTRPVECGAGQTAIILGDCWSCVFIDTCAPSCSSVSDCVAYDEAGWIQWSIKTYGHWSCSKEFRCEEVADMEMCGNKVCDTEKGETANSCAPDCHTTTPECQRDSECKNSEFCGDKGICQPHECGGADTPLCEMLRPDCGSGETAIVLGDCWKCVSLNTCRPGCEAVSDCVQYDDDGWILWDIRSMGHWSCTAEKNCKEVADSEMCGNSTCDTEKGETKNSCSVDCVEPPACSVPSDCVKHEDEGDLQWPIDTFGHWECTKSNTCQAVAESDPCGDLKCNPEGGESSQSCPKDCGISIPECTDNSGCTDISKPYCDTDKESLYFQTCVACLNDVHCKTTEYCSDKGTCVPHECKPFGAGMCDTSRPDCDDGQTAVMGETCWECVSLESCEPLCSSDLNCATYDDAGMISWLINGFGHWVCNKSNQCDPVSESTLCGDGKCDAEGGETKNSCPKDCATGGENQCSFPVDCVMLNNSGEITWVNEKSGYWECNKSNQCQEVIDSIYCGDEKCNGDEGESKESCPIDCAS